MLKIRYPPRRTMLHLEVLITDYSLPTQTEPPYDTGLDSRRASYHLPPPPNPPPPCPTHTNHPYETGAIVPAYAFHLSDLPIFPNSPFLQHPT